MSWVNVTECQDCKNRDSYWSWESPEGEGQGLGSPCFRCGGLVVEVGAGKWIKKTKKVKGLFRDRIVSDGGYWMLRSEEPSRLPSWKNPESPDFDARRVEHERLAEQKSMEQK